MKKKYFTTCLFTFLFSALGFGQNGIIGSGFGTNDWSTTDNFTGSAGNSRIATLNSNGTGNSYFRLVTNWDSNYNQWGPSSTAADYQIFTTNEVPSSEIVEHATSKAYYINTNSAYNYVFKTKEGGNPPSDLGLIVFEIQGFIANVVSVNTPATTYPGQTNTITAALNTSLPVGQGVYLRYTTDNFATSTVVGMTGSGVVYTADIPSAINTVSANVSYYVFTSGSAPTIAENDADWYTINLNNNSGTNYSYTVSSSYASKNDGVWSDTSTWMNGTVPDTSNDVVINHHVVLDQDDTVASMTIATAKSLILNSEKGITISGDLNINGSLTANSGSSLIVNGSSAGNVTYIRNLATDNWYLISSPVAGESVVDFLNTNTVATGSGISPAKHVAFANYDNTKSTSNSIWQYYVDGDFDGLNGDDTTDMMSSGKGYSVKPATVGSTFSFTGTLNTANVTTSIMDGKTVHVDGSPFNLIGNPFTSFVNNSAFLNLAANDNLLESKTIWVWDQSTETYTAKVLLSNFEIAPAQGFFVKRKALGTAASLTFDATNQSHQSDTFQRSFTSEIQLNITDGTKINYAKFYYVNESTTGFDNGYDGELFGGAANSFAIYSHLLSDNVGKKYQIQALPNANLETMIVPIGLHAENGKTITFSAESLNLPSHLKIFLEDREKGSFTRLDEVGNTYTTTLTASLNGTGRFYLYTTESALNTNDNAILSTIGMFQSDATTLKITGLQEEKASLKIFTTLGKEVINTTFEANGVKEFSLPNLAKGVYLVQLKTEKGMVNKKIIFE
ncbi:T9SS type A sorting domain-containing protein [Polaribacter sp.]|uniref:T9SS type A sorting domain-containing protein n=1 Tax=Polaribacter sp. TaxID=1920175 RepID=UPI003EFAE3E5